jgi:putative glutamine amidotransferase
VTLQDHAGWYLGVQWHPEDSAATDPVQAEVFRHFVDAAAEHMRRPDRRVSASAHV